MMSIPCLNCNPKRMQFLMVLLDNNIVSEINNIFGLPNKYLLFTVPRDWNLACIRVLLTCIRVLSSSLIVKVILFFLSIIPVCCFINSNSDVEITKAYSVILRIFAKKLIMNCLQFCL